MKYARVPYMAEGAPFEKRTPLFSDKEQTIPIPDYPIDPIENFKLSWKNQTPVWAPNSLIDFESVGLGKSSAYAEQIARKERFEFTDEYGCEWVWVTEVGGAMLKPGTVFLDDVTKWESIVKFPDWNDYDFKTRADDFHITRQSQNSVLSIDIGSGGTERLVALLGGYEQGMLAMAMEPEAVSDLISAITDNMIKRFDAIQKHYPSVNMITYHDDWGNERSTFFSAAYLESMIYEPTKKLVEHIHAAGDLCFQLHCCGKIETFVPYMIDMGVDMLQIQRRANDMPMLKRKFGDKIGMGCSVEGIELGANTSISKENLLEAVRNTIDIYGKSGGLYLTLGGANDEETMWDMCYEAYCYSREFYDNERKES